MKTIYDDFVEWMGNLPAWIQEVGFCVINKKQLTNEIVNTFADKCIAESKGEKISFHKIPIDAFEKPLANKRQSIISVGNVVGVNAIANQSKPLEFKQSGLTIIYGDNGSGKSGYMRIFKKLFGSKYQERIVPNVFSENQDDPSCSLVIHSEGTSYETIKCDLQKSIPAPSIGTADVFDTLIAQSYIESDKEAVFEPYIFSYLRELTEAIDKVRVEIERRIEEKRAIQVKCPLEYTSTERAQWLTTLSKDSTLDDDHFVWDESDQQEYDQITKLLSDETVSTALQLLGTQKTCITALSEKVGLFISHLSQDSLDIQRKLYSAMNSKQEEKTKIELLFKSSADDTDIVSMSRYEWTNLWKAINLYSNTVWKTQTGYNITEEGASCPVCHQTIPVEKQARIKNINEYVNGHFASELEKATRDFKDSFSFLKKAPSFGDIENYIKQIENILTPDDVTMLSSFFKSLISIRDIESCEESIKLLEQLDANGLFSMLEKHKENNKKATDELEASKSDNARQEAKQKQKELLMKQFCNVNKDTIKSYVEALVAIDILEKASKTTATNRITIKARELSKKIITDAYIERFNNELRILSASKLKVTLAQGKAGKGHAPNRIVISPVSSSQYPPRDILSEGEKRVVSLAAFFADTTGREEDCPIIIDDPISSLDYSFEGATINRIFQLSLTRQVIVFTHRISMVVGLEELCKAGHIDYAVRIIGETDIGKGVPYNDEYLTGNVKAKLNALKNQEVNSAKKANRLTSEYKSMQSYVCQQFRICLERSIEDVLLNEVIKRFRRSVVTKDKLNQLTKITFTDCQFIENLMTKYSYPEHSQPQETPLLPFDINEIENDIDSVILWITEFQKRSLQNAS